MALDTAKNFAKVTVSTGYNAAAVTIVLNAGDGAKLPTVPFNAVWWNALDFADPTDDPNVEIVRVTNISTDTLTVTRAQESTSASTKNTAGKTYKMVAGLTAKVINTDIGALFTGWDAANVRLGIGTTAPAVDLHVKKSVSGGNVRIHCENSNTAGGSNAFIGVAVQGATGGNPFFSCTTNGVQTWALGQDATDSQKFKFGAGADPTINTVMTMTTGGIVLVGTSTDVTGQKLQVAGNISAGTSGTAGVLYLGTDAAAYLQRSGATALTLYPGSGTGIIYLASKVGVNLASPNFDLHTPAAAVALGAPASAPTDGNLNASNISFYLDEVGNTLKIRVKYSNGTTLKTGTIALI